MLELLHDLHVLIKFNGTAPWVIIIPDIIERYFKFFFYFGVQWLPEILGGSNLSYSFLFWLHYGMTMLVDLSFKHIQKSMLLRLINNMVLLRKSSSQLESCIIFMHKNVSWTLVLDVYFDHKFKISMWRRIKNERSGGFYFLSDELCLQSAHLLQSSLLMVPRRKIVSWTGILRLIISIRNILGSSHGPHLLEQLVVVAESVVLCIVCSSKSLSPWRIIVHSLRAIRSCFFAWAEEFFFHCFVEGLLRIIGWRIRIPLPLLSRRTILGPVVGGIGFDAGSILSIGTLIFRICFAYWAIHLLWVVILIKALFLVGIRFLV